MTGSKDKSVKLGNLELIIENHGSDVLIDGECQILTPRDLSLLDIFLQRPGLVVPNVFVADQTARGSAPVSEEAVEVYVHRLRKFLDDHGATIVISAIKGAGYSIGIKEWHLWPRPDLALSAGFHLAPN
jgi:DNA-binding response OmpR family regulator